MSGAGPTLFPGRLPSPSLFEFPPRDAPRAIPPPFEEPSFKTPFPISDDIYNAALDFRVPATIATVYATTVVYLNWVNRRNGNKPWAISKTRAFKAFVILHNVFLAVYSAVTCVAMVRALKHSIPHYSEPNALVGTIDALCKMHGPRGLGDAVTFTPESSSWGSKNRLINLGEDSLPDFTDVGRVWNEGLAFWGWIFYLSKFYEVLDTAIIIAKGKRSTTLQTYHHAGAMLCMWAGIRFMSPPIWMFALVNSGIHAMMYTYYTISALGFRVPQAVKRTLTSLQILQFVVGATFAGLHLFVSYTAPVSVAYKVAEIVSKLNTTSIASAVSSATGSSALSSATGTGAAFLKKLVYRAAGEEGLAENVGGSPKVTSAPVAQDYVPQDLIKSTIDKLVYRTEYETVACIDTTGQAFAIYLNLIYLLPLTGLFLRFFIKSYLRRTSPSAKHVTKKRAFSKSLGDAMHGVDREVESLGMAAENGIGKAVKNAKSNVNIIRGRVSDSTPRRAGSLSPANQKFLESFQERVSKGLKDIGEDAAGTPERAKRAAKDFEERLSRTGTPKSERAMSPVNDDQQTNGQNRANGDDKKLNGNGGPHRD
ncbi:hypothetical protein EJ04DRAFT_539989 [Polyplosphaeria fusca]|uniref:Elongation of fatty acids protein n=1 Tax=Polyplosphaeria fusca TaxID=682080 RepID=A0A9P4RCW9_9PLEO|nr:hypothetical protein EJ04DRAFT_539989 [Polyplosphaeria fusca]